MTMTEPALCTRAPTTGLRIPVIARIMATKFSVMEKVRLQRMVNIMRFARRRRCGISRISSFTRAISAASTAMSLPDSAHGDAHTGFFQSRRIVDAVADHAYFSAFLLSVVDPVQLILRQTCGENLVDLKLRCDVTRRIFMIARQQHRCDTCFFYFADGLSGILTQRIGEGEKSRCLITEGCKDDGTPFFPEGFRLPRYLFRQNDSLLLAAVLHFPRRSSFLSHALSHRGPEA